jgi:hypothetical protein
MDRRSKMIRAAAGALGASAKSWFKQVLLP